MRVVVPLPFTVEPSLYVGDIYVLRQYILQSAFPTFVFVSGVFQNSTVFTPCESRQAIPLKVPKCEIFDPIFFTLINPIWVGDLRTREKKKKFRRLRQIFAILFFLRRLSLR
jgi:hypothetical protein